MQISGNTKYVPPIICKHCGKKAYLVRRKPHPYGGGREIQTFECGTCGKLTETKAEAAAGG